MGSLARMGRSREMSACQPLRFATCERFWSAIMAKLASLADAKSILRYDGSGQDAIIETALDAASSHILGYLGVDEDEFDNDSSDPGFVVPHRVEMACIMYAGIML